jgi:UDP-N-acetylmuramoylalanine--D-glutamate ligase
MDSLLAKCANRIKIAILIGTDRGLIETAINKHSKSIKIEQIDKTTDSTTFMDEIVKYAKSVAQPGDTVLLAPACASMDQFRSYAERGELFAAAVKRYA